MGRVEEDVEGGDGAGLADVVSTPKGSGGESAMGVAGKKEGAVGGGGGERHYKRREVEMGGWG